MSKGGLLMCGRCVVVRNNARASGDSGGPKYSPGRGRALSIVDPIGGSPFFLALNERLHRSDPEAAGLPHSGEQFC